MPGRNLYEGGYAPGEQCVLYITLNIAIRIFHLYRTVLNGSHWMSYFSAIHNVTMRYDHDIIISISDWVTICRCKQMRCVSDYAKRSFSRHFVSSLSWFPWCEIFLVFDHRVILSSNCCILRRQVSPNTFRHHISQSSTEMPRFSSTVVYFCMVWLSRNDVIYQNYQISASTFNLSYKMFILQFCSSVAKTRTELLK